MVLPIVYKCLIGCGAALSFANNYPIGGKAKTRKVKSAYGIVVSTSDILEIFLKVWDLEWGSPSILRTFGLLLDWQVAKYG